MNPPASFLWHDYETFGTHPALDRPAQFAALRTDADLNQQGEPLEWFCAPADDVLPHPAACLVTGITPQEAQRKGVCEAEFARLIHHEMMEPGTCSAGYNSLRFDDEFTRNLLYRNLRDPYEREWRNGNSRWDLIDLARMCYALRPDGIEWPEHEPGNPSFRLEDLTAANGIEHSGAHDALADVRATIALARLLKARQGKLFEWALGMRDQAAVLKQLDPTKPEPMLHTSARIPAARGCTSLFLVLAALPDRRKSVIAVDLAADPQALIDLSAEEIADRVFTPAADLPDDVERIPLKAIHSNKVPMIAPAATLRGVDTRRIALDVDRCQKHADLIRAHLEDIRYKVMDVFATPTGDGDVDPDLAIYKGGFFSNADRALMNRVIATPPDQLAGETWSFSDPRLETMLFRYRARNFPETLDAAEAARWASDRDQRLRCPPQHGAPGIRELQRELVELRSQLEPGSRRVAVLDELESWYRDRLAAMGE
ncbi:MAG: exodeoxyribonuclease I [Xanthomonadales bacterium]|nr:exodeoxyribonuclease I [Xanthomonadales bacterium]